MPHKYLLEILGSTRSEPVEDRSSTGSDLVGNQVSPDFSRRYPHNTIFRDNPPEGFCCLRWIFNDSPRDSLVNSFIGCYLLYRQTEQIVNPSAGFRRKLNRTPKTSHSSFLNGRSKNSAISVSHAP